MAQLNSTPSYGRTHEGAPAKRITPEQALRRSVMSCLLWEKEFYESGQDISGRIVELARQVDADTVAQIAVEARNQMNLRHVPLLLVSVLAQQDRLKAGLVPQVVNRADELAELITIHCHINGVGPDKAKKVLSHQLRKGLAKAFAKFDEYQLGKYNRAKAVKLRDVLRLVHPKPITDAQSALWKRLNNDELAAPDTWEVALSKGGDKKAEFERLLHAKKLGYMALLRNLRNMDQAGVDSVLIHNALLERKGADKVLPFRFVAAVRAAPRFAESINMALMANLNEAPKLPGQTLVLVDVSYSMVAPLSGKSDLNRMDAAAALGSIFPGEHVRVMTFSDDLVEVPGYRGLPGIDSIIRSQRHSGTDLGGAIRYVNQKIPHDRLVVITDEQSRNRVPDPVAKQAYMINVASAQRGVGYGKWTHIDGFSEAVLKFIREVESQD